MYASSDNATTPFRFNMEEIQGRRLIDRAYSQEIQGRRLIDRAYSQRSQWLLRVGATLGLFIYLALLPTLALWPKLGLRLLWFLFIPIAPMFLLVAPNAWVSLCPVSSAQTLARRFGWRRGRRLSPGASHRLQLLGWILMFLGIPSRHLIFNTNGSAVFAVAIAVTLLAVGAGLAYYSLSGWCVGACPIRPVEVLYGQFALDLNRPEKCMTCDACVAPCVRLRPENGEKELNSHSLISALACAFPGFVAAYFLLDLLNLCTAEQALFQDTAVPPLNPLVHAGLVYGVMAAGSVISLAIFAGLGLAGVSHRARFRAAALTAYVFYYLGVMPGIMKAWSLSPAWGWALVTIPFLTLAAALFAPRRDRLVRSLDLGVIPSSRSGKSKG